MKKLALLLGAVSLVSSVAYAKEVVPTVEEVVVVEEAAPVVAAPALKVTSIGQYIEVDNDSGSSDIGEAVFFGNTVGLAYDDWTFGLLAAKIWDMDTDNGIHSSNHRLQLDAWKNFENFSIGARWRGQSDKDRFLLRAKYGYGMFSGWVDAGYEFKNTAGASDNIYSEGMPVAITLGPVTLGYYFEYFKWDSVENDAKSLKESDLRHQVRLMAPLYTGEKLSLGAEYRYQFAQDIDMKDDGAWQENNRHIGILSASYALTDNLTVDGYYEYDWNKYDGHKEEDGKDNYYGEFYVGWTYTF